jgi:hypothetical protein
MVSAKSTTIIAKHNCMVTDEENTRFNLSVSPVPNSNVIKRLIAADKDPLRIENIPTTPPTTPYIPKSSTPNVCNTTLLVYNETSIENNIRTYSTSVFFAIRLLFSDILDIYFIMFRV